MFERCGEQYRRRYVEGEIIPPGIALIVGSATHVAIERDMKEKLSTGKLLALAEVQQAARDAVNLKVEKEGVSLDEGEDLKASVGEAVDTTVALSTLHHEGLAPDIKPAHVERPWVLELSGFPFDLAGRIDLQEIVVSGRKAGRIIDTKTAKRADRNKADDSEQLSMYALAAKTLDGEIPDLRMDLLIKTKVPKSLSLSTSRTDADLGVLLRRVEAHANAIEKGVYHPAPADHWICSTKFCGYARTCPFFRRRVVVAI